jgi:hypothetical protein
MGIRRLLARLPIAALALGAVTACKSDPAKPKASPADLDRRCTQIGPACGEKVKHQERMIEACQTLAKKQVEKSCTDHAIAVYDCYDKELCGAGDKVWALDDLRVLAERKTKCVPELKALRECVEKK